MNDPKYADLVVAVDENGENVLERYVPLKQVLGIIDRLIKEYPHLYKYLSTFNFACDEIKKGVNALGGKE